MARADRIEHWVGKLNSFTRYGYFIDTADVDDRVEPGEAAEAVLDARVQKAMLVLVKEKLDAKPEQNQRFVATTEWKVLNQLLTVARVKELTGVRIVKKGRTSGGAGYDVDELARTYYGRQVLDALGFSKQRRVLNKKEFDKVKAEFEKIKLALPEAVEPTKTEKYFAQDEAP